MCNVYLLALMTCWMGIIHDFGYDLVNFLGNSLYNADCYFIIMLI